MSEEKLADISKFESLQNEAHQIMGLSGVEIFNDSVENAAQFWDKGGIKKRPLEIENPVSRVIAEGIEDREKAYEKFYSELNPRYDAEDNKTAKDPFQNPLKEKAKIRAEATSRLEKDKKEHRLDAERMNAIDGTTVKSDVPFFEGEELINR